MGWSRFRELKDTFIFKLPLSHHVIISATLGLVRCWIVKLTFGLLDPTLLT
jgi:hypothetical protein